MSTELVAYYARRAAEYERIYQKPERQPDLARLRALLAERFAQRNVLEIACGTGYWTEAIAPVAHGMQACDINDEVLAIARGKPWPRANVQFARADAYALPSFERPFDAGFSGFWWSHVPRRQLAAFFRGFHARLAPGALVTFTDNRYVPGSSTPIAFTDANGDTFQRRRLEDGSTHDVLKNFPSPEELRATILAIEGTTAPEIVLLDYFWVLHYQLAH